VTSAANSKRFQRRRRLQAGGGASGGTCHWGYRSRAATGMAASARRLVERLLPLALALMLAARLLSRYVGGVRVYVGGEGGRGVMVFVSLSPL
jgi:hypothetical protein